MKKAIIIILAIVLLLVGGIWLYLLLYGAPDSAEQVFTDLGFGGVVNTETVREVTPEEIVEEEIEPEEEFVIEDDSKLIQLTNIPSAGAIILGTTTQTVRYVEKGLGYIHEININNGYADTKLTSDINSGVTDAIWSPNGEVVVLVKDGNLNRETTLFFVDDKESVVLPPDIENIGFSSSGNTLYYTRSDSEGTLGYSYNVGNGDATAMFSIPFTSVGVHWVEETLIYNLSSELHRGYAYHLDSTNSLRPISEGGIGLVAFATDAMVALSSVNEDGEYYGYIVENEERDSGLPIPLLPEKCVAMPNQTTAVCGYPIDPVSADMPNDWYKGLVSTSDDLWLVNMDDNTATWITNLAEIGSVDIDIENMVADILGEKVVFANKNNNRLWLYDLSEDN